MECCMEVLKGIMVLRYRQSFRRIASLSVGSGTNRLYQAEVSSYHLQTGGQRANFQRGFTRVRAETTLSAGEIQEQKQMDSEVER